MSLIIAILAGICPDWWPRRWPPRPGPRPDPWRFLGGLAGALGGGLAWTALGREYGNDGLSAAVIIGLLGGTAALWLLDAVRGGGAGQQIQP